MDENEQKVNASELYQEAKEKVELLEVLFQPEDIARECEQIADLLEEAGDYEDAPVLAKMYREKAVTVRKEGKQNVLKHAEKIIGHARSASDYERGIGLLQDVTDLPEARELMEQYRREKRAYIKKQNIKLGARILFLLIVAAAAVWGVSKWLDRRAEAQKTTQEITLANCSLGDKIFFGNYKWKVIDKKDDEALLIAVESDKYDDLTNKAFHNKAEAVTWETSDLRNWLNGEFLENGFSEEEQEMILVSSLNNEDNSEYHTAGGADTEDAVFIFSEQDAEDYWEQIRGFELNWLLRTPGNEEKAVMYVSTDHKIRTYGTVVTDELHIRPVIRVKLTAQDEGKGE